MQTLTGPTAAITAARNAADPLASLGAFRQFTRGGLQADISCTRVDQLPAADFSEAFSLLEANMKKMYEESSWGWKRGKKRKEMREDGTFYLLARGSNGGLLGFVSYQIDIEDGCEVIYCYEAQVDKTARGSGLGKHLMQVMHMVGMKAGLEKAMLTVFTHNERANGFFKQKAGYSMDPSSPQLCSPDEECDYEILSRPLKKKHG